MLLISRHQGISKNVCEFHMGQNFNYPEKVSDMGSQSVALVKFFIVSENKFNWWISLRNINLLFKEMDANWHFGRDDERFVFRYLQNQWNDIFSSWVRMYIICYSIWYLRTAHAVLLSDNYKGLESLSTFIASLGTSWKHLLEVSFKISSP